jgi:2-desacetyl-2-hydroxyethyl bacteriochlorophyllide A dehydrogenase
MRALVKTANKPNCMEIREIEKPVPRDHELLIRVLGVGVCGTDLHIRKGEWICNKLPVVMGHEFCGQIEEVGKMAKGFKRGERVVVEPHDSACGICEYCLTGRRHLCLDKKAYGIDINGGYAEYVAVDANLAHKLREGISPEEGALIEPTAVVCHGVLVKGTIKCTDRVAVVGPGPIGILSAQVARAVGAQEVIVAGVRKDREIRLKLCEELGFPVYEAENTGAIDKLKNRFDVAIEASGFSKGIGLAIDLLKKDKQLIVIGIPMEELSSIPWEQAVKKSETIICSYSSSYMAWEMALTLVSSGKIKLKPLISHNVPLEDWEKAFDALEIGKGVKAVLRP